MSEYFKCSIYSILLIEDWVDSLKIGTWGSYFVLRFKQHLRNLFCKYFPSSKLLTTDGIAYMKYYGAENSRYSETCCRI